MNKTNAVSFLSGALFGLGLAVSEMINPQRVIGFLSVTGNWDPTLALVMAGAVTVTLVCFPIITRRERPIYANSFSVPKNSPIDTRLIIGSILFGIGWGIAGLCPGPAIAAMATASGDVIIFIVSMLVGYAGITYLDSGN